MRLIFLASLTKLCFDVTLFKITRTDVAFSGARLSAVRGLRRCEAFGGARPSAVRGLQRCEAFGGARPSAV